MARNPTTQKPTHQEVHSSLVNLHDPPPAIKYSGLRSGPLLDIEYEENLTPPIDGSDSISRVLSPFIIQVEPPLILGSEPASMNPNVKGTAVTGLYTSALKARSGFASARSSLAMTTYVRGNYGPGTAEEVISRSSAARSSGGTRNSSGDGTRKTDASGMESIGGYKTGEPAIADLRTAVDIASQLKSVLSTPPLVLLINPQSLDVSYSKIQSFQDRTRFGYVFQAWGEEQPTLSISAKCGAFISGGRGVQWASRRDSAAWQNMMAAFQFYRNNGYIYDTVGKSNAHLMVGALSIRFDQWIYYGSMKSLSYGLEDSSNMHGGVTFAMDFAVSSMVDTASPSFKVDPMRGPNPPPNGNRFSGVENRAFNPGGISSVSGVPGSTQESPRTGTSSALRPEKGTPLNDPDFASFSRPSYVKGATTLPTSKRGFQPLASEEGARVNAAPVDNVIPFRVG